jgi:hypothetical protein
MRKSIPIAQNQVSRLSVSYKVALLTRILEILVILSLALADGACSTGFIVLSFKANPGLPLTPSNLSWSLHGFSFLWMSVTAILATLEVAKYDETMLPEDGRYFLIGTSIV